ncbi:hypothetical protein SNE40_018679 [Patella caerulea]|uniref:Antistasin-like domain-containing protein n=1 Tax=Patella caerulea TaxID=87958 RepID=A0AAN8J7V4_PATCE
MYLTIAILSSLMISLSAESADCPKVIPGIWGCAYMPKCFADSMCSNAEKCCHHPCGNQCMRVVHCIPVDCGNLKCEFGFDSDSNGCDVCKCRTTKKCGPTDVSIYLYNTT